MASLGTILGGLLNLRREAPDLKNHKYTSTQAYFIAIVLALVVLLVYLFLVRRKFRYSTALALAGLVFLLSLSFLDFTDQIWYRILTFIILGLLMVKILGFEVFRIIEDRDAKLDGLNGEKYIDPTVSID
jgi:uncharacterized membrane protein YkgB